MKIKRIIKIMIICAVLCFSVIKMPVQINASTKKITCVSYEGRKNSGVLKSGKTYKINKNGNDHGYLRFKASKTKTYTFVISDYRSIGKKKSKDKGWGFMAAYREKELKLDSELRIANTMFWDSIKFQDDDIEGFQTVNFASEKYSNKEKADAQKYAMQTDYSTGEKYYDEEIAEDYTRTYNEAKMTLKKGQVIYLKFGNSLSYKTNYDEKHNKGFTCILKIN